MIVYFSGTGNSKYCAEMLADKLEEKVVDSFSYIRNQIAQEFVSATPWIFVSPTYCWQLPHIFEDFLKSATFQGSKDAYFVMTCGSDIGNAGEKIKQLCQTIGLNYQGVLPVVMPENYIAMFESPDSETAKRIVLVSKRCILKGVRIIQKREPFPTTKVTFADRIKTGPVNPLFYKLFVKAKPFHVSNACISCGKCVNSCVLGNISMQEGKPVWGKNCTHCMACICGCPTSAIEYGKISKGKHRYICQKYEK